MCYKRRIVLNPFKGSQSLLCCPFLKVYILSLKVESFYLQKQRLEKRNVHEIITLNLTLASSQYIFTEFTGLNTVLKILNELGMI